MSDNAKITKRPGRDRALFLVALVVIFAGLAGIVLLANNSRNLNRLLTEFGLLPVAPPPPIETDVPAIEPAAKPSSPIIYVPEHLTGPPVIAPQDGFHRTITRGREDICNALQKSGWVGQQWQVPDLGQRTWSCGAEKLVASAGDPDSTIGSLFVSARGTGSDNVSSVRLKANFLDGEISGPVHAQAVSAALDILDAIGWGEDPEIIENLRQWKVFEIGGNGNTISLSREPTDIPRYNFLIASDPSSLIGKGAPSGTHREWLKSPEPGTEFYQHALSR